MADVINIMLTYALLSRTFPSTLEPGPINFIISDMQVKQLKMHSQIIQKKNIFTNYLIVLLLFVVGFLFCFVSTTARTPLGTL